MELQDIIEAVDIVEYISKFCDLELQLDGEYWGLSPLQNETTPSFSVCPEKQTFYCFSSGVGGNVLEFIKVYHKCDLFMAIQKLKDIAGVTDKASIQQELNSLKVMRRYRRREKKLLNPAKSYFSIDQLNNYELNPVKFQAWIEEGISLDSMMRFKVRYDPVADRLVFPVRNVTGEIINLCGRTLDPNYKEKGLRKYTYYRPLGTLNTLGGLYENSDHIREKGELLLLEGLKSVMLCDTWGISNATAAMTSHLNPNQLKILIQLGVRVVVAFDKGVDVQRDKNLAKLKRFVRVEYINDNENLLKDRMAPVDRGRIIWEKLYSERRPL